MPSAAQIALQWLSKEPQNRLICCNYENLLPPTAGPPRGADHDWQEARDFMSAMLDFRLENSLTELEPGLSPLESRIIFEVERTLKVEGGTILKQARYVLGTPYKLKNREFKRKYLEVHAADVSAGETPAMWRKFPVQNVPCRAHQPPGGRLWKAIRILRLDKHLGFKTPATGKWMKSGDGDVWRKLAIWGSEANV